MGMWGLYRRATMYTQKALTSTSLCVRPALQNVYFSYQSLEDEYGAGAAAGGASGASWLTVAALKLPFVVIFTCVELTCWARLGARHDAAKRTCLWQHHPANTTCRKVQAVTCEYAMRPRVGSHICTLTCAARCQWAAQQFGQAAGECGQAHRQQWHGEHRRQHSARVTNGGPHKHWHAA